ncbi:MAG: hypothetical protein IPL60_15765 [Ardenticatenia bacterium]|nr:hypothetical protein [Ardenticatenia bacterium]
MTDAAASWRAASTIRPAPSPCASGRSADQPIDEALLRERVRQAAVLRRATVDRGASDAWRLVHGEADGLPALVADRYGTVAVLRCGSPAVHGLRAAFAAAL